MTEARGHQGLAGAMSEFVRAVPDELVTRRELAGRMRVSVATVDRLIAKGLPTVRFSPGTVRIWANAAMAWAAECHEKRRVV